MAVVQPKFWESKDVVSVTSVDLDAVTMLPNGGYVVAFRQNQKIGFQIYNGNGDKVGGTHFVADPAIGSNGTALGQWEPTLLTNPDGSFVVSWTEAAGSSGGGRILRNQVFDINGNAGTVKIVSSDLNFDGAHLATNGNNSWSVAYIDGLGHPVIQDVSSGNSVVITKTDGSQISANGKTGIALIGTAAYAVSYGTSGANNGYGVSVFAEGTKANLSIAHAIEADVTALKDSNGEPNGHFVVTYVTDDNIAQIIAKTYHFDQTTNTIVEDTGSAQAISTGQLGSTGYRVSTTALHDGGYAVAYKVGTGQSDVWVKVVDANGTAGPAIQIPVDGQQVTPAIVEMADGRLAVSWHNPSAPSGGSAIETTIIDARATAVTLTGTDGNDVYAPSANPGDHFDGGAGFDTLTFKGASGPVSVNLVAGTGSAGDANGDTYANFEKVIGTSFDDVFVGGSGHVLVGGAGNDTYYVTASDTVIDESGGGYDQVYASVSYILSEGIENLFANGAGAINLTGNASNNIVVGNADVNHLSGMGGNDALYGAGGNDVLDGGDGDDVLDGGAGADMMSGGAGNDTYYIDDVNDQVSDTSGVDTVVVSVDYDLDKLVGIENITGSGSSKITLRGTSGNNTITGSSDGPDILHGGAGNDILYGQGGNDVLYGEAGRDILYGGTGRDIFVFDTPLSKKAAINKANIDTIADFNRADDSIYLENKVFKALGKKGSLAHPKAIAKDFFYVGTKAHDANDHIIYNKKTGALYYDADGTGHQAQIQIATLTKHPKIDFHDFFVI